MTTSLETVQAAILQILQPGTTLDDIDDRCTAAFQGVTADQLRVESGDVPLHYIALREYLFDQANKEVWDCVHWVTMDFLWLCFIITYSLIFL